jgi:hypothetical protein
MCNMKSVSSRNFILHAANPYNVPAKNVKYALQNMLENVTQIQ